MLERLKLIIRRILGKEDGRKSVSPIGRWIGLLGVTAALAAGCGGRVAKELPFGNVDTPKPGATIRGSVRVSGWALSPTKIKRVEVYLDRIHAGTWTIGVSRPDVQAAYPSYPDSRKAGFDFRLDLTGKQTGAHELTVQVWSSDGGVRELCSFPIVVSP